MYLPRPSHQSSLMSSLIPSLFRRSFFLFHSSLFSPLLFSSSLQFACVYICCFIPSFCNVVSLSFSPFHWFRCFIYFFCLELSQSYICFRYFLSASISLSLPSPSLPLSMFLFLPASTHPRPLLSFSLFYSHSLFSSTPPFSSPSPFLSPFSLSLSLL